MTKHGALDDAMVLRIIEILKELPGVSQEALGERLGVTRRIIQKHINLPGLPGLEPGNDMMRLGNAEKSLFLMGTDYHLTTTAGAIIQQ